jgi:hypothetical protein
LKAKIGKNKLSEYIDFDSNFRFNTPTYKKIPSKTFHNDTLYSFKRTDDGGEVISSFKIMDLKNKNDFEEYFKDGANQSKLDELVMYKQDIKLFNEMKKIFNEYKKGDKDNAFNLYMNELNNTKDKKYTYLQINPNEATKFNRKIILKKLKFITKKNDIDDIYFNPKQKDGNKKGMFNSLK